VVDFVHLHCHSEYSLLDGMSTPLDIARVASSNGQFAAAITDHGTMGGVLKFQDACDSFGVRPLFGIEAYFVPSVARDSDSKQERFHLILLAKNDEGLRKLFKANSVGWGDNFYYKPRLDFDLLEDLVDGDVVALSGCMGGAISKAIERGDLTEAERLSERFISIFGDDFYYEVQAWNPVSLNKSLIDLASSFGKKVVATADCHFPTAHDAHDEEVLLMISQYPSLNTAQVRNAKEKLSGGGNVTEMINRMYPDRFLRFDEINPYVADASEVMSWFADKGFHDVSYFENTVEVADKCSARLKKKNNLLPKYIKALDSDQYLMDLCLNAIEDKGLSGQVYLDRLGEEISIISSLGFADYFLMVWDLVKWADMNNIGRGPGRGSVGGSLIAFLLDISKVDPIKYGLLFSRFLNPDRNDYPDIDLDFEDKRRELVKQYLSDRWGSDNVAAIATYGVFKPKSVIKDVARVFQVPFDETNSVTPFFETLDELQSTDKGKVFIKKYPDVLPVAKKLEGRIRNTGVHAAGMVVSSVPLTEICPVESRKNASGDGRSPVTSFDMEDAESIGLIKVDILGLKTVSVIKDCIEKIREIHGVDVTEKSLALDDVAVFQNFNDGNTVGVFQADAAAYRNLIDRMGIDNFNDLVVSNALVRPGALLSQGQAYIDCKKGVASPKYPHEVVKDILSDTYGTVIFQEQLMQMAVVLADFSWSEADKLRKIIGKKRDAAGFDEYREKFCSNTYLTRKQSEKIWADFELAALYMFNKSHAVAYSMLSYQTMWLKINYPREFIWSMLSNESEKSKITAYLMEAERLGITVLPPDVNASDESFSIDENGIRFGLKNILGCGKNAIAEIFKHRPYSSYDEFVNKCSKTSVKAPLKENMEKVGCFQNIGYISSYDFEKYYLPILGFAFNMSSSNNEMDEFVEPIDGFHEIYSDLRMVKAVIRSTKKTPKYLRVEMEDQTASVSVFCDRNAEIANRDFLYCLIGDRTLHMFCDAYDYVGSDLYNLTKIKSLNKNHEYSWLYDTGLGDAFSDRSLLYIFSTRTFVTAKGKDMANVYAWDGERTLKIVVFPSMYAKMRHLIGGTGWFAAKLNDVKDLEVAARLDSYTFANENSLITIEDYINRKNLKAPE
jgi:DNA polymerase-3 subunit alpha